MHRRCNAYDLIGCGGESQNIEDASCLSLVTRIGCATIDLVGAIGA